MPEMSIIRARVKELAGRYGARNIRVFGSYAKGRQTSDSDLDLLVELEEGRDLLDLVGFKESVEEHLGIRADVLTVGALSPYLRELVLREAQPL